MPVLLRMLGTFLGYKIPDSDKPAKKRETAEEAGARIVGKMLGAPRVLRRS